MSRIQARVARAIRGFRAGAGSALALPAVGAVGALGLAGALALLPGGALAAGSQPAIEEVTISKVTERSARMRAKIDPNEAATEYAFYLEYKICQGEGVCPQLWKEVEVAKGTIPAGTTAVTVSAPPLRLTPGCRYEYHVVAQNAFGRSHTNEQPGDRLREFETKRPESLPEPHQCAAAA